MGWFVAPVGRLLWRTVKLARFCQCDCTLKNLLYTQVPIPIPLATLLVKARRFADKQPIFERRCPLAAPSNDGTLGDMFFYCMFYFCHAHILHIRSFTHHKKKKEKVKKKYLMR